METAQPRNDRVARRMLDAFPGHVRDIKRYAKAHDGKTLEGSQLARELAEFRDPEVINTAFSQGCVLFDVVADHILTLDQALTEPMSLFAPWTLLRGAIEAGAQSSWLLDPSIDAGERAKRGFAFRFTDLTAFVKSWGAMTSSNDPLVAEKKSRIDHIENQANALGMERILDRHGNRIGIGRRMPKATELVGEVFGDSSPYRLLSGAAHAHSWMTMWIGYGPPGAGDETSGFSRVEKRVNPLAIMYLVKWSARAFGQPIWNRARLCGWDLPRFRAVMEGSYDDLGLPDGERFWREAPA